MISNVVAASAARTATGTSETMRLHNGTPAIIGAGVLTLGIDVTAVSGTSPSMTVSVEWSFDGGTTFLVGDPADAFTAKTATGTAAKSFQPKGNAYRLRWTITGTTPSFTFSAREVQY